MKERKAKTKAGNAKGCVGCVRLTGRGEPGTLGKTKTYKGKKINVIPVVSSRNFRLIKRKTGS